MNHFPEEDCGCGQAPLPAPSCGPTLPPLPECDPSSVTTIWAGVESDPVECDDWTSPDTPSDPEPSTPSDRPPPLDLNFDSDPISFTTTRTDCPSGQVGLPYTYTMPAGTFKSSVSKADANAKAQTWWNQNGQSLARLYGLCAPEVKSLLQNARFAGTSGCPAAIISNLTWGDKNKQYISGCQALSTASSLSSVQIGAISDCPASPGRLFGASIKLISGCQ